MNDEQPLANVVAGKSDEARGEEKMKRLMELVSMMNMTIGKDEERDRLLAEKERAVREAEARETEWKSRWEESKRAHGVEIARMKHDHDQAKERASRENETRDRLVAEKERTVIEVTTRLEESKRVYEIEMDRIRRIHDQEKKALMEAHEKRLAELESRHRDKSIELEGKIKMLNAEVIQGRSVITDLERRLEYKTMTLTETQRYMKTKLDELKEERIHWEPINPETNLCCWWSGIIGGLSRCRQCGSLLRLIAPKSLFVESR